MQTAIPGYRVRLEIRMCDTYFRKGLSEKSGPSEVPFII